MPALDQNVSGSHLRAALEQLIEEDSQLAKFERRSESRYPFFQPVTVTFNDGSVSGVTRQISPSGIGLLHCAPLNLSMVKVTMRSSSGYAITLPVEVTWCRSCGPHWYVSGGRFLDSQYASKQPGEDSRGQGVDTDLLEDIVESVRKTILAVVDRPTYGDHHDNRRSEVRYHATLPVTAIFEDKTRSIRDSIRTVTRDISNNGISLISDQAVTAKLLTLEISDRDGQKTLTALMEMLRCRPIGHLYEIAGRFVTKVYGDEATILA